MKKFLMLPLLSSLALSAQAYNLNLSSEGLKEDTLISFVFNAVAGDCQIVEGEYKCAEVKHGVDGLPLSRTLDYFKAMGHGTNQKISKLSFEIEGFSSKGCQELQKKGQNLAVTLTPDG